MTSRESEGIWKTNIDPDLRDAELFLRIFRPRIDAGGPPAAVLALYQLPGTNSIQAVDGVKKLMEEAKRSFPPDMEYVVALDTTFAVREGIKEVLKTLQ